MTGSKSNEDSTIMYNYNIYNYNDNYYNNNIQKIKFTLNPRWKQIKRMQPYNTLYTFQFTMYNN